MNIVGKTRTLKIKEYEMDKMELRLRFHHSD